MIGFIYESRPNVTADAAGLCLKSGNAVILKGGSEAINSNLALAELIGRALAEAGLPAAAVQVVPTTDREATMKLLQLDEHLDLIIPRGGEGLIRFVAENSASRCSNTTRASATCTWTASADRTWPSRSPSIPRCKRPGVCNALETLLVHRDEADRFLPLAAAALEKEGVELRCCPETLKRLPGRKEAVEADWPANSWT